jgi:integrase
VAYSDIVRCRLIPRLGQIRLTELRGSDIQALYKALGTNGRKDGGPLSPGSVEATHRCLHRALQQAVEDGVLQVNPADIPKRKKAPNVTAVLNPWTPDELKRFKASVAGDRLYPLWATAIATGCRRGELAGLRWDDVDLDAGRITVINTRTSTNYRVYEGTTKTGIGRPVGINAPTVAVLRQWHADQAQERMLAGEARVTNDYVFTEPDGSATHPESITNRWDAAVKRSGLRRQRFHDVRHAHASLLAHNGLDMVSISKRLGHSSPTLTMNLYVHANTESDDRAVATFSKAMGE